MDNPNRSFVMVSEGAWLLYHEERRSIDRRYPLFVDGFTAQDREAMADMRRSAREELRAEFRTNVLGHSGPYLIPV